jgi:serine/threonine protein kinase
MIGHPVRLTIRAPEDRYNNQSEFGPLPEKPADPRTPQGEELTETVRWIGSYQVFEAIGRGGGGVVYRGLDSAIGREVAIKELRLSQLAPEEASDARRRFAREASAVGRLRHAHVVTLYQFLEENDALYLVMEYVAGGSLRNLLAAGRRLSLAETQEIVGQIAAALDEAHAHGIVHRDIKPANILLGESAAGYSVKVADFGIARISSQVLTTPGIALGTPSYMAPEQVSGLPVTAKADQFSLAVLTYQLLARRLPFEGDTAQSTMLQILHAEPRPLGDANPEIGEQIESVIRRALDKNPARRFESCGAFAGALKQAPMPVEPTTRRTPPAPPPSSRGKWIAAAVMASALLAAGGLWWWAPWTSREGPRAVAETSAAPTAHASEWTNPKDGLVYISIPAGTAMVGCSPGDEECTENESPPRSFTVPRGFRLGKTEVTQAAYLRVSGSNPSHFRGDLLPAENVSQEEAARYCASVGGRLPTADEWEYAARGGAAGVRYGPLDAVAWHWGNSGGATHPAALKQPNAFGLYDMLGNVWEWTSDGYIRGGGWDNIVDDNIRVSFRASYAPSWRSENTGFRCAID